MTVVEVDEVTEFRSAVAGVEIDWMRTDRGWGGARMVSSGDDRAAVSVGGLDFSSILHTDVPDDRLVLQLLTAAPHGMTWCGTEADDLDVRLFRPSASVIGNVPAGSRAVTLVADADALADIAVDLGLGDLRSPSSAKALPVTDEVGELRLDLLQIARRPQLLEQHRVPFRLLESTARAIASVDGVDRSASGRGFDSGEIVTACIEFADAIGEHQPTMSELCRVACASESRLRQAFVEVVGVPPIQFFQIRVLSHLRDRLLVGDADGSTVTETATSLGLTQLGRVAGRYRALFGETPRDTLRRRQVRRF